MYMVLTSINGILRLMAAVLLSSVWFISLIVCSPPWFVPGMVYSEYRNYIICSGWGLFTQAASKSSKNDFVCVYSPSIPYRIYSASGSFYIPLLVRGQRGYVSSQPLLQIMLFVYFKIFKVASEREKMMRQTMGTCRLSRRIDKTRRRPNPLQCNNYHNRYNHRELRAKFILSSIFSFSSAPVTRIKEMQVSDKNDDTPPTRHKNSLPYSPETR